ncbi:hypothetical protein DSO57_1014551 [Entomophthora muscae]|uniref:Uncharacterized protein n=1 Tax=Entomophthora muscae TaxID=34485 RepID=A0ACC2SUT5_9FUNG|nr:hypothetical protein DSO57_1014551 [Entomophthora muscae]
MGCGWESPILPGKLRSHPVVSYACICSCSIKLSGYHVPGEGLLALAAKFLCWEEDRAHHRRGDNVRNIPDTYSCVINKLSPAATEQTSTVTKQSSVTNVQTSAAIKQIHTSTMQKPATAKLSPAVNMQAPTATKKTSAAKQIHTATTQKPATTKLLPPPLHRCPPLLTAQPASHTQTRYLWASLPPASLCPPMPAGQSPSTPLGNTPDQEIRKGNFPKAKLGRNCCPIWEPTKWGMD